MERNDKLQSRRDFFKKALSSALPILGIVMMAQVPTITKAVQTTGCNGCQDYCVQGCRTGCGGRCSDHCALSCSESCRGYCTGGCKNGCGNQCRLTSGHW